MQLSHTFEVPLPVEDAWTVLTDVERVGPCLPGATIEEAEGEEFRGLVTVKVGPIKAEYRGEGRFVALDRDAGREVTLTLADCRGGTRVDVTTHLSISGRLAQFGRGVIGEVADRLMGQFVANRAAPERRPVVDLATVDWPDEEELTHSDEPSTATEGAQLLSVVALPVLKRLAPVVGAAGAASLGWWV